MKSTAWFEFEMFLDFHPMLRFFLAICLLTVGVTVMIAILGLFLVIGHIVSGWLMILGFILNLFLFFSWTGAWTYLFVQVSDL